MLGPGGNDDPSARGFHRCGPARVAATARLGGPATRRRARRSTRCPASAPRSRSACARSASRRCATCCSTGRGATSAPSTRSRSRSSGATRRSRSRASSRTCARGALGGRRTIVTARIKDASGMIGASWFNQPWLVDKLTPGTHLRLRGKLGRYGFDVKSYDVGEAQATADFAPVYPASEQVPSTRLRDLVRVALAQVGRYLPDPLPAELELPLASRRARGDPLPARRGGGRGGAPPARARRARRAAARRRALARRGRRRDGAARSRATLVEPLPRRAAVRADRAPGARDRRDRPRPGAHDADAAAAAGRRRLRQDGRRALRAAARGRERPPGRADGADRDARRAALPDARAALRRSSACAASCSPAPSARRRSATRSRTASRRSPSARTR